MSWLEEPADDASPQLARLVARMGSPAGLSPVLRPLKLNPAALGSIGQLSGAFTFGGTSLGRRTEELISTAVSAWNQCFF